MKLYHFIYRVLGPLFRRMFKIEVTGAENEPSEGGFLACPNHLSNWDVIILAVCLHRPVRYFAKAELFKIPLLNQLITVLGAFPAARGAADLGALKKAMSILKNGDIVGFFPQGTRCPGVDPRTTEPKNGVAVLAHRSGAKVLPIYIETKDNKIRIGRKVTVHIGTPIESAELALDHPGKEQYAQASRYIFDKITDLGVRSN